MRHWDHIHALWSQKDYSDYIEVWSDNYVKAHCIIGKITIKR